MERIRTNWMVADDFGDIGPLGKVDAIVRCGSKAIVVLHQALADIACRNADDGVLANIVCGGAAEELRATGGSSIKHRSCDSDSTTK